MKVIERKNILPFVLVTSLFALWGLANNMTDTLLAAFKRIMDMSDTQTSFIHMAFFGAYFCIVMSAALLLVIDVIWFLSFNKNGDDNKNIVYIINAKN